MNKILKPSEQQIQLLMNIIAVVAVLDDESIGDRFEFVYFNPKRDISDWRPWNEKKFLPDFGNWLKENKPKLYNEFYESNDNDDDDEEFDYDYMKYSFWIDKDAGMEYSMFRECVKWIYANPMASNGVAQEIDCMLKNDQIQNPDTDEMPDAVIEAYEEETPFKSFENYIAAWEYFCILVGYKKGKLDNALINELFGDYSSDSSDDDDEDDDDFDFDAKLEEISKKKQAGKQQADDDDFDFDAALDNKNTSVVQFATKPSDITPRFIGNLMITPALHDEESFGDRFTLWSKIKGKAYVWGQGLFDMIKKENPAFAEAIVKLSGEWRSSLPDANQIGNDKLNGTLQTLEYGPWIANEGDTPIGLALLTEWGRFVLSKKEIYEAVQEEVREFMVGLGEELDDDDYYDMFEESEYLKAMWGNQLNFARSGKFFIETPWKDVPQHGRPEPNQNIPNLNRLDYPDDQPEDDEDYGEPYETDFGDTDTILGGGSRLANSLLKSLADSGANIVGVGPNGIGGPIGIGPSGVIDVPKPDNIESKNAKSGSFDKQKGWKDVPDFDPKAKAAEIARNKKDDDDDIDFDHDSFEKDFKAMLGDDFDFMRDIDD